MFTFRGKEYQDVYVVANGSCHDPYEAIEEVHIGQGPALSNEEMDDFITENLEYLAEMVKAVHQQWAEAQLQAKQAFDDETSAQYAGHRTLH